MFNEDREPDNKRLIMSDKLVRIVDVGYNRYLFIIDSTVQPNLQVNSCKVLNSWHNAVDGYVDKRIL